MSDDDFVVIFLFVWDFNRHIYAGFLFLQKFCVKCFALIAVVSTISLSGIAGYLIKNYYFLLMEHLHN